MSKTIEDQTYSTVCMQKSDFLLYELKPEDKVCLRKAYLIRNGDCKTNQKLQDALIELIQNSKKFNVTGETIEFYSGILSKLAKLGSETISSDMTLDELAIYKELQDHMSDSVLVGMKREIINKHPDTEFMEGKKCKFNIYIKFLYISEPVKEFDDKMRKEGNMVISYQKGETLEFTRETGELINLGRQAKSDRDIVLGTTKYISRQHISLMVLRTREGAFAILRDNGSLNGSSYEWITLEIHYIPIAAIIAKTPIDINILLNEDSKYRNMIINLRIELLD